MSCDCVISNPPPLAVGILVGGASRRMAGVPKGLLPHPTEAQSLVQRTIKMVQPLGAPIVLVGSNPAYSSLGLPFVDDNPAGVGPIGGLAALLASFPQSDVIALACDLPFVPLELLERLVAATDGAAVVPFRHGVAEPLCSLYRAPQVLPVLRDRIANRWLGIRSLIEKLPVTCVNLVGQEGRWVDDWDSPSDLSR